MITYKIDVLTELNKKGYPPIRLRKDKLLGEKAMQSIRHEEMIGMKVLNTVCMLLDAQPGDIIEYKKD